MRSGIPVIVAGMRWLGQSVGVEGPVGQASPQRFRTTLDRAG